MQIITLNKENRYGTEAFHSVMDEANKNLCIDYSEKPAILMLLLAKLDISIKFTGIKDYFNDKKERLTGQFKIKRDNKIIIFDYGFSLNDTKTFNSAYSENYTYEGKSLDSVYQFLSIICRDKQEFFNSLLYNCLCSCKLDYYISIDFEEFCSEFGFNPDSIKDKKIWERCLKQSNKPQKIFKESEIECLPD
jgi:hypothetical protein